MHTRHNRHAAMRRLLRYLWEHHGAPKLDDEVPHITKPRPRPNRASRQQIDAILAEAPPDLQFFVLLCSDTAIRSGTAVTIGPRHYDPHSQTLTFTTKKASRLRLPTTAAMVALIEECDLTNPLPFITQLRDKHNPASASRRRLPIIESRRLRAELKRICQRLGFPRIIPHDLRRTTAVAYYQHTHDLRRVQTLLGHRSLQSTLWYLDNDLDPVELEDLEAIKKPFIVKGAKTA